jgi:hypothetical protein
VPFDLNLFCAIFPGEIIRLSLRGVLVFWFDATLSHAGSILVGRSWNFGISTPHGVGGADKTEYRMGVKCNGNGQVSQIFLRT